MGDLVAVGGLIVEGDKVKLVEDELKCICAGSKYNVPPKENIKWSPSKGSWLNTKLDGGTRQELFGEMLDCLARNECCAIVAISDSLSKKANSDASDHEVDATLLALERFDTWLGAKTGLVVVSKPAGGDTSANKFVAECIEKQTTGTRYVPFNSLVLAPVVMPAWQSRMLQVADLIVSITNAKVAGGNPYADALFEKICKLMPSSTKGLKGGVGLKIHPSFKYQNLYHWVLGDDCYAQGSQGVGLPELEKPYAFDEMKWKT